jgi:hypothetical protein
LSCVWRACTWTASSSRMLWYLSARE